MNGSVPLTALRSRIQWLLEKACSSGIAVDEPPFIFPTRRSVQCDESIGNALIAVLEECVDLEPFKDGTFRLGDLSAGVSLENVLCWLLLRSQDTSPSIAVAELQAYLEASTNRGSWVFVLNGWGLTRPYRIARGVALVPITLLPDSPGRRAILDRQRLPDLAEVPAGSHAVLTVAGELPRQLSGDPNEDVRFYTEVQKKILWLTLAGPSAPTQAAAWWQHRHGQLFYPQPGLGYSYPRTDVSPAQRTKIGISEVVEIRRVYKVASEVPDDLSSQLAIPLGRLNQSIRRTSLADRAIDLGISLEALLLHGIRQRTELAFRIRLHGALLVGENESERRSVFSDLKEIYNLRSAAVHEGRLGSGHDSNRLSELLMRGSAIAARAIEKIAKEGFPDWDSLALGAPIEIWKRR